MSINDAAAAFSVELDKYDWFYSIDNTKNIIIVYVNYMSSDIFKLIPLQYDGYDVKCHFEAYQNCEEKYGLFDRQS